MSVTSNASDQSLALLYTSGCISGVSPSSESIELDKATVALLNQRKNVVQSRPVPVNPLQSLAHVPCCLLSAVCLCPSVGAPPPLSLSLAACDASPTCMHWVLARWPRLYESEEWWWGGGTHRSGWVVVDEWLLLSMVHPIDNVSLIPLPPSSGDIR